MNTHIDRLLSNHFSSVATSSKTGPNQADLHQKNHSHFHKAGAFKAVLLLPSVRRFSHSPSFYGASKRSCLDENSKGFLSAGLLCVPLGFECLCFYLTGMLPGHEQCKQLADYPEKSFAFPIQFANTVNVTECPRLDIFLPS